MKLETLKVRMKFTTPVLGSQPGDPEVFETFVNKKAPTEEAAKEEAETLDPTVEFAKGVTIFPKDEKGLFAWDYQVRGFIKEKIGLLIELGEITGISKWAHKKAVDSFVFVKPRRIYFMDKDGKHVVKAEPEMYERRTLGVETSLGVPLPQPVEINQRPLRATTLQGDRICLAASEQLPEGVTLEFQVEVLSGGGGGAKKTLAVLDADDIRKAFSYGDKLGFGQWRSGGWGRFTWEEVAE